MPSINFLGEEIHWFLIVCSKQQPRDFLCYKMSKCGNVIYNFRKINSAIFRFLRFWDIGNNRSLKTDGWHVELSFYNDCWIMSIFWAEVTSSPTKNFSSDLHRFHSDWGSNPHLTTYARYWTLLLIEMCMWTAWWNFIFVYQRIDCEINSSGKRI